MLGIYAPFFVENPPRYVSRSDLFLSNRSFASLEPPKLLKNGQKVPLSTGDYFRRPLRVLENLRRKREGRYSRSSKVRVFFVRKIIIGCRAILISRKERKIADSMDARVPPFNVRKPSEPFAVLSRFIDQFGRGRTGMVLINNFLVGGYG